MKRIIPHIPNITATASMLFASVIVFASAFLLSGCSDSESLGGDDNISNRIAFTIKVTDGGYASIAGEKSGTRATEKDYVTQFTAGDKIGVYAVKNGSIVDRVNNLCLVATATTAPDGSNSLVWQTEDGKTPLNIFGATYYAYYPWQSNTDMEDKVTVSASDAAGFFANVISGWTPSTNQGTYTAYTSADLMIASATASDKTLSFSMQHQMALVVIDLPKTKYTLQDASGNSLPDYIIGAPDAKFDSFTPCWMSDGTYRYLINPSTTGSQSKTLSGSYTNATPATARWTFTADVPASQYKKFVVDKAPTISKQHILQAGDFFMKDGTLLSKTESLSDEEKATCIGIVYWVGDPTKITPANDKANIINKDNLQGDKTLAYDHPNCIHGLVISLGESSKIRWQKSWTSVQDWLNSNCPGKFLSVQSDVNESDALNNIQGYNNTKAIEAFNAANKSSEVHVVEKVVEYRQTVPAPATSSDWYTPSAKEVTLMCWKDVDNIWKNRPGDTIENFDLINTKLGLITGATRLDGHDYFSSTERNTDGAFFMGFYAKIDTGVHYDGKTSHDGWVRYSLAF